MIRSLVNISLSILLFLSATGLTVNLHYCHERIYDVSLISPARHCCDPGQAEAPFHHENRIADPEHCRDDAFQIGSTNDYLIPMHGFQLNGFDYPGNPVHSLNLSWSLDRNAIMASHILHFRSPPPPNKADLSRLQTFLL
jgi:hypothetical protein